MEVIQPDSLPQTQANTKTDELMRWGNFPPRLRSLDLDALTETPDNREALAAVKAFVEQGADGCLLLYGPAGTGKTHMACGAIRRLERRCRFYVVPELMLKFQASVKDHGELDIVGEIVSEMVNKKAVMLFDDLAAHRVSEFGAEVFGILLDRLYNSNATGLVFTSNLTPGQIAQNVSDRIASRLCGMCDCVKVSGKDWRVER